MGFGTLFIGYFLLLNLTYYGITDVIAASVMLLGLYKLSTVNKHFRYSAAICMGFLAFSIGELGISVYEMFFNQISSPILISCMSIIRSLVIGAMTVFMLLGIEDIAREVEIEKLSKKARALAYTSAIVYAMWIILELPISFISNYILAVISLITIIATLAVIVINLSAVYACYMKICMPGDEDVMRDKPSRFAFVNRYRERKAERDEEERARRIEELKKKNQQKGKKK